MDFDYIVIGAGSAGCVLAERLSDQRNLRILVIEAGGSDARFWIKVPLGYGMTYADPRLNWGYTAQPDPGLKGRATYWPRGRVVGGSSSINAMAYVRGLPHDFDDWNLAGATGWTWEAAEKTFGRVERTTEAGRTRGDGRLHVSDLSAGMHPFSRHFLAAAHDLGWPTPRDMNDPGSEGLTYYRSTVRGGLRCSAADAFLNPALRRGNVKLLKNALVQKLLVEDGRATGVQFRIGGQLQVATARCEVILSAGAVNSPQLLQLSGLGPADLLRSHGIAVHRDLPQVGKGCRTT